MDATETKEDVLVSVEKLKLRAGRLQEHLISLHQTARFDRKSVEVADRARRIETEADEFSRAVRELCNSLEHQ